MKGQEELMQRIDVLHRRINEVHKLISARRHQQHRPSNGMPRLKTWTSSADQQPFNFGWRDVAAALY
jgi:hypothetical protein